MPTTVERTNSASSELHLIQLPVNRERDVGHGVFIPAGIVDRTSFRAWCISNEFPSTGRFDLIDDTIWADLSMEEAFTHSRAQVVFNSVLESLSQKQGNGYLFNDRMRLVLPEGPSVEPDSMFIRYSSIESGKIAEVPRGDDRVLEFEGTPDMDLEIVSNSSVRKDLAVLPRWYESAGVDEFWRIDARGDSITFDLFILAEGRYVPSPDVDGWRLSPVFATNFRVERSLDPLGKPCIRLFTM